MDTTELQKVFGYTPTTSNATSLNHDEQAVLEFMQQQARPLMTSEIGIFMDVPPLTAHARMKPLVKKGYVFRELARCGRDNKQQVMYRLNEQHP